MTLRYTWKRSQIYYNKAHDICNALYTSYVKKWSYAKYKKNSEHKLLFGHVQTQCFYIVTKTYESIVSIIQLYNLATVRKRKKSVRFSFLKLNSPFTTYFSKSLHMDFLQLKQKKSPTTVRKFFENQKVSSS